MKYTNIYVACHKQANLPITSKLYTPIQVGTRHTKQITTYLTDDTGEHISSKNPFYSELTGWYWIWKNENHDIVGTSHYRRFFTTKESRATYLKSAIKFAAGLHKKRYGLYYTRNIDKWKNHILDSEDVTKLLKSYDIILPQQKVFKYSVEKQYAKRHRIEDLKLMEQIVQEQTPDYYSSFKEVLGGNRLYSFNMFITSWELFDNYMSWLFPLLFELEKRSNILVNDTYQKRVCAFMAERLQNVWLHKTQLKTKELPVIYFKKCKEDHF
ncbi:DUF4422 domain-containing protein [uncultured Draconibacterium sp.]|uniref:DUF4422 domain-containing protein n=1 Tax=uncultured Draconibacterium sp. TaxID=1573823 RepID=UPI0029C8CFD8|nr:DUF4422 domain-containing protein [uncultured Draconibacterium sp.]